MYQKLIADGTIDQPFVDQLLAEGQTAVDNLNGLDKQLRTVAKVIASNAGTYLLQAGINAAQGMADGIAKNAHAAIDAATNMANAIIKAVNKALNSHSPSRVFVGIGQNTAKGMAIGIDSSADLVTESATNLATAAITAMNAVVSEIDPNPTIKPVLDLTDVQAGADKIASILAPSSFTQASAISAIQAAQTGNASTTTATDLAPITFEQNNYSPAALSAIDIYRSTKNQLSQARKVLAPA